jgi:diadenosine tetraphosphatase ApaH/serine/threonine PP2A family protein phosphatase
MDERDGRGLEEIRQDVRAGHEHVRQGRYREARIVFDRALPDLTEALGADHPEVEELVDDIETVDAMAGVADFGATMGYRWNTPTPGAES